ncbi:MAG: methylmalonyl Co-A mutase-associated GTPase MeaB, partial [Thermodesulfobacteriota bacterium]|nr:methylmalonyl Co-A mutase-associated GTPase MeaB [Thermodesulfobacteriota bacterium]
EKAEKAKKEFETALHLLIPSSPTWTPPVLTCSALEMRGIDEIWKTVLLHRKKFADTGELEAKRKKQAVDWIWSLVEEGLKERFYNNPDVKRELSEMKRDVEKGVIAPTNAATRLLEFY